MAIRPKPYALFSIGLWHGCVLLLVWATVLLVTQGVQAQTYSVLYSFSYYNPETPLAGLTIDRNGILYGTTSYTDAAGRNGGAFKMKRSGSSWLFTPLHDFPIGGNYDPNGPMLLAPDGTLYGTLYVNYGCDICGGVFRITPPATFPRSVLTPWNAQSLYTFTGHADGSNPQGPLVMDAAGNIYGTAERGGSAGFGVVYQLTRSGNDWTQTIIHNALGHGDGLLPINGLVQDSVGNLYGVYEGGGANGQGAVYELSNSGSGWTEQFLYSFTAGSDGEGPTSLIMDGSGNLYGATVAGGSGGGGIIFKLTPSGGVWSFSILYSITGSGSCAVVGRLTLDSAGNLYGATYCGGAYSAGSLFKLTNSQGNWTMTDLYDFTGGNDGKFPNGGLVFDAGGNLYGTTSYGGLDGGGVVFELAR